MSASSSGRRNRRRAAVSAFWLGVWVVLEYAIAFFIVLFVGYYQPSIGAARTYRIIGPGLNLAGAIFALSPRVFRDREATESELAMTRGRERLAWDTYIARLGLSLMIVGFFLQLIGNLAG